jgi:hypothetical protein
MATEIDQVKSSESGIDPNRLAELLPRELAQRLRVEFGVLPKEAIREVQRRRDEMVPELIELLEAGTAQVPLGKFELGEGPFFAFMLLIEFEAESACDAIFRAISLEQEQTQELLGDAVHGFLPYAVPGVAHRRIDEMLSLACNPRVDSWVRSSLVRGICLLEEAGKLSRERIIEMVRRALQSAVEERNDVVVTSIAMHCSDSHLHELHPDIREANRLGLLDEMMISFCEVEEGFNLPHKQPIFRLEDTIKAVEHWGCFSPKWKAPPPLPPPPFLPEPPAEFDENFAPPGPMTIRLDTPHVGRNEPCPCGSGKKYKKCCGKAGSLVDL